MPPGPGPRPSVSDPVTVEAVDAPAEVTVTNTPTRVYAPLSITKVYQGPPAALVPGAEVAGAWSCDYQGAQVDAGRWRLPAAGGSVDIARADGTLAGENGAILLPATSVCTVVEDTPPAAALVDGSYAWNAPTYDPASGTVTLAPTGDNEVTVTNSTDRVYGSFRVTKVIDLDGPQTPGLQFTGTWTCTHPGDPDVTGTWQVDRRRHRPVLGSPGGIAVPDHRGPALPASLHRPLLHLGRPRREPRDHHRLR